MTTSLPSSPKDPSGNAQREPDSQAPQSTQRQRKGRRRAGLPKYLLLAFSVLLTFGWILGSNILWTEYDASDRHAFVEMEHWTDALTIEYVASRELLPALSYFAEQLIPLPTASVHRGINLILHISAALLLLRLLQNFRFTGAFVASLAFALHPTVTQTLFWPGYRIQLIGLIFILLTVNSVITCKNAKYNHVKTFSLGVLAMFIHPAGIFLPVIIALAVYYREKQFSLAHFNISLPLLCAALLIGSWMQSIHAIHADPFPKLYVWVYHAGQNLYFLMRQAFYPESPSLFYPYKIADLDEMATNLSLLPFCVFIPFYALALFRLRRPGGRILLLGISTFILLLLPGLQTPGSNLEGSLAHEDYGLYLALAPLIALLVCGTKAVFDKHAANGKSLWFFAVGLLILSETLKSGTFSYQLGSPEQLWRLQSKEWPDQWMPKVALIHAMQKETPTAAETREQMRLLEALLKEHPDRLPERKLLLQYYRSAGEKNNALREYRYILRETDPDNEFLEEATRFFESIGRLRDAELSRSKLKTPQKSP